MCDTCGCGQPPEAVTIRKPGEAGHTHLHDHGHEHEHDHDHHIDSSIVPHAQQCEDHDSH